VGITGSRSNVAENTLLDDVGVNGSYSTISKNVFSGTIRANGSHLNISSNTKDSSIKIGMDSGIKLEGAFCTIYGNVITAKRMTPGIGVDGKDNLVIKNIVENSDVGIRVNGSNNFLCANIISDCMISPAYSYTIPTSGIALQISGDNLVYANGITDNSWGMSLNQYSEIVSISTFYHNNFIGNTYQVVLLPEEWLIDYTKDSFDNDKEGNFWSDYNGTDRNGDGIGDTPYIIDARRMDRYPLMAPYDIDIVTIELPNWANPIPPSSPETELSPTLTIALTIAAASAAALITALIIHAKRTRTSAQPPEGASSGT
jgi:hypothetical protein